MECIEVIGGIKSEPTLIKEEPTSTVEIGIDDIFSASDEENINDLGNKKEPQVDVKSSVKGELIQGESQEKKDENGNKQDFIAANNLETNEKLILNFAKNGEVVHIKKKQSVNAGDIDWAQIYKTTETTNCQEEMEKVIVTDAPQSSKYVAPHEYTTLSRTHHVCNHCQKAISQLNKLKYHIKRTHRELTKINQCPYCPYKSKWDIKTHILLKHKDGKEIQWFQCHKCDGKFKLKGQLRKHMLSHLSKEELNEQLHACSHCDKKFKIKNKLTHHIRLVHTNESKVYNCQECMYTTKYSKQLKNHVQTRHTDSQLLEMHQCKHCDYKSKYALRLQTHSRTHQTRFFCETCGFKATCATSIKLHQITHQEKINERDLKYRCGKCDYKTYRPYSLEIHKLNHLKPHEIQYFYCYHCDFKAKRKDNLKSHVLRHFKKEEINLYCFICDYSTKKKNLLINHINKHAKEQNRRHVSK